MLKRFTLKNALSNQLPQNPSAATSRHALSWKLAEVVTIVRSHLLWAVDAVPLKQ